VIRVASTQDRGLIFSAIQREAHAGHFNADYLLPAIHLGLLHQIDQTILSNKFPTSSGDNSAQLFVAEDNGTFQGFIWIIQDQALTFNELYLSSVEPTARSAGIGTTLFTHSLEVSQNINKFQARCYPQSTYAISILSNLGFSGPQSTAGTALLFVK
jgi:N-acetylglutamate synthase-like GNAT family acetyltransferase